MNRVAVLDVVGLTRSLLGSATPNLERFRQRGWSCYLEEQFPAVTCTSQAAVLTGKLPREHGIVGNGWYFRELAEVGFWGQNNGLIRSEKIYERLKREHPGFTCAKLFWWFNMYSQVDWSITPRPHYPADGRKVFDVYTQPARLRDEVVADLGVFPFPAFWGPRASIASSRWIARSAKWIFERHAPTLSLVYLPHLDYGLQKHGPDPPRIARDLAEIDQVVGELIRFYESRDVRVIVLSEYGITPVRRVVHPNRILRAAGLLKVRPSLGREILDCGASEAFGVADHQICHVYVRDPARLAGVARLFEGEPGTRDVLAGERIRDAGLDHSRSGNVVLMAESDCWYTYYFWDDDARAPDFARCVDIHRKPGYDPVELFLDPDLRLPGLQIGWKLLRKRLGFRTLMNVIPLRPDLVRGSHGTPVDRRDAGPILLSSHAGSGPGCESVPITAVRDLILRHVLDAP